MESFSFNNYRIKVTHPQTINPGTSKVMFAKKEILLESIKEREVLKTAIYIDESNNNEFAEAFASFILNRQ